jgi:hypothetical protein
MTDGVIAGTGNSRTLKVPSTAVTAYATYSDFMTALAAGTFEVDLGYQSSGWTVTGTALNKASLLTSATETLLGITADSTVDEALAALSPYYAKISSTILTGSATAINIPITNVTDYKKLELSAKFLPATTSSNTLTMRFNSLTSSATYYYADYQTASPSTGTSLPLGSIIYSIATSSQTALDISICLQSMIVGSVFGARAFDSIYKYVFFLNPSVFESSELNTINILSSEGLAVGTVVDVWGIKA